MRVSIIKDDVIQNIILPERIPAIRKKYAEFRPKMY